jgi:hypothetical protein
MLTKTEEAGIQARVQCKSRRGTGLYPNRCPPSPRYLNVGAGLTSTIPVGPGDHPNLLAGGSIEKPSSGKLSDRVGGAQGVDLATEATERPVWHPKAEQGHRGYCTSTKTTRRLVPWGRQVQYDRSQDTCSDQPRTSCTGVNAVSNSLWPRIQVRTASIGYIRALGQSVEEGGPGPVAGQAKSLTPTSRTASDVGCVGHMRTSQGRETQQMQYVNKPVEKESMPIDNWIGTCSKSGNELHYAPPTMS